MSTAPTTNAPETEGPRAISRRFGVGYRTVHRWIKLQLVESRIVMVPGNKMGHRLVNVESVRRYINGCPTTQPEAKA